MTRSIVICADDFGLCAPINAAVVELAKLGRVSAISCMTEAAHWREGASALNELRDSVGVGLHFNLTEGGDCWTLSNLMLASFAGRLPLSVIGNRLDRQLDAFEEAFLAPPDFVDGHQHVHMLPGIRRTLVSVIRRRYGRSPPWIRWSRPPLLGHDDLIKALVLRAIGAGFPAALARGDLRMNLHFAGLYSLRPDAQFPLLVESWLRRVPDGTLIMCHPGLPDPADDLRATREAEYRYLRSERFLEALQRSGRAVARHPALG
jgi:chitin disaccharide deacetylase